MNSRLKLWQLIGICHYLTKRVLPVGNGLHLNHLRCSHYAPILTPVARLSAQDDSDGREVHLRPHLRHKQPLTVGSQLARCVVIGLLTMSMAVMRCDAHGLNREWLYVAGFMAKERGKLIRVINPYPKPPQPAKVRGWVTGGGRGGR